MPPRILSYCILCFFCLCFIESHCMEMWCIHLYSERNYVVWLSILQFCFSLDAGLYGPLHSRYLKCLCNNEHYPYLSIVINRHGWNTSNCITNLKHISIGLKWPSGLDKFLFMEVALIFFPWSTHYLLLYVFFIIIIFLRSLTIAPDLSAFFRFYSFEFLNCYQWISFKCNNITSQSKNGENCAQLFG